MIDLGLFAFPPERKRSWQLGYLREEWAVRYPHLFDLDDIRLARNQGSQGYHFIEWQAAITLHELTGYLALVSKYEFANHPRKTDVLRRILMPSALAFIRSRAAKRGTQCPDLLMYAPDYSGAFFCEVKGPGDRLRHEQVAFFGELDRITCVPVHLIRFREDAPGAASVRLTTR